MTKKIFLGMSAMAMLFATSCQNDLDMPTAVGGEATVSFNVATPEIGTRAYGDGQTAKLLQYAVYDAAGNHLYELDGRTTMDNRTATVELQLTTGNTYNVIFWAAAEGAPYTFTSATKAVTVDYANVTCNNENYDAFYTRKTIEVRGANTENVTLTRPFAQLNIGTADYEASRKAGFVPEQSTVKVSNIYSVLGLWNGEVSTPVSVEFKTANINRNEAFPVEGNEYIAMNYLLVPAAKETVEVEFGYGEGEFKTRTVGSVPVQRNYRTNIYGNLLTSEVDINVTIDPIFNEPAYTVFEAFENGGTVDLTENITIDRPLVVEAGVKAVLNLNGFNIINTTESEEFGEGEGIIAYGDLTINGEGTVQGSTMAVWARGDQNAKVTINGGTYKGCDEGFAKGGRSVIYASSGNVIDIYGGEFQALAADMTSYADKTNGVYAALNVADNNGMINVYGGRFYKQNPAAPGTEPSAWNAAHPNGFVDDGYSAVSADDWYVVGKAASNVAELKDALSNAPVVNVEQAIDNGTSSLYISGNDVVINMEGKKVQTGGTATSKNYGFVLSNSDVTINDANIDGGGIAVTSGSKVTFNTGLINVNYSGSSRYAFYIEQDSEVVINGGDFKMGRTSCPYFYIPAGAKVTINGGRFVDKPLANDANKDKLFIVDGGELIIKGGEFQKDPSAWVATGYKAVKSGSTWTVVAE